MASTASIPVEQSQVKLSFAKVAASSYKPEDSKENPPNSKPSMKHSQSTVALQRGKRSTSDISDAPKVRIAQGDEKGQNEQAGNTVVHTGQWAKATGEQAYPQPDSKNEESEKQRPAITFVKSLMSEDSTTQLSSSDGSAKPPSLDGKSVASAATFALDEKESLRPDDSASLRAVEEEDITSPPDSVAAGSRGGSDSGVARAFRDQLHEIAVMGPHAQRGAPPGRFPNPNVNGAHTLFDPNQPQNGIGRPLSQPVVNGIPNMAGSQSLAAIPDEKLIEALESPRDRLFVLKLEQDFIDFIKGSENEWALPNTNTFYRMLAHRLADYYLLGHTVDETMTGVRISRTSFCRIPPPLSGLPVSSKNANTPPVDLPARKIMRRGDDTKSGTNTTVNSEGPSKTTSEADGTSGSEGGNDRSESDNKEKSALTREEREARYREARQRIFGNSENGEGDSTEAAGSGEEKDISRSSSASGKKKNRKQRNYDDDFEARSRFNAYYPQQYSVPGFSGDQTVYYESYPGQMPNPQFPGMSANVSPPPTYNNGYPIVMPQDQYAWPGQQFQPPNEPMGYPNYGPTQNGYDLSADFQRGMQSFQSVGMPSQVTPKMANAPMASYPDKYQPQPMPMNGAWSHTNQQSAYPMVHPLPYAQTGPGIRPMSAPIQGPAPGQYPYGQFPTSPYNGKPNRNQHPLPGSFNRQQFNPQSQSFIPGGRNVLYQMQPNVGTIPPQGMNGYGNYQMPMTNQMPRPSPPVAYPPTFGSPRNIQGNGTVPVKISNPGSTQTPQVASSQIATAPLSSSSSVSSSIPAQSSIAKWGTPSHLPPKPPVPAQPQPPKFNLPSHSNFPSVPRLPNNMAPGYPPNSPSVIRGSTGPGIPNNKP